MNKYKNYAVESAKKHAGNIVANWFSWHKHNGGVISTLEVLLMYIEDLEKELEKCTSKGGYER